MNSLILISPSKGEAFNQFFLVRAKYCKSQTATVQSEIQHAKNVTVRNYQNSAAISF